MTNDKQIEPNTPLQLLRRKRWLTSVTAVWLT